MSIPMEAFAAEGQFATIQTYSRPGKLANIWRLQCHGCGYEPQNVGLSVGKCPKCGGDSWERFSRPGSLLKTASRNSGAGYSNHC